MAQEECTEALTPSPAPDNSFLDLRQSALTFDITGQALDECSFLLWVFKMCVSHFQEIVDKPSKVLFYPLFLPFPADLKQKSSG